MSFKWQIQEATFEFLQFFKNKWFVISLSKTGSAAVQGTGKSGSEGWSYHISCVSLGMVLKL